MNVRLYTDFTGRAEQERVYELQLWIGLARLVDAGIPEAGNRLFSMFPRTGFCRHDFAGRGIVGWQESAWSNYALMVLSKIPEGTGFAP